MHLSMKYHQIYPRALVCFLHYWCDTEYTLLISFQRQVILCWFVEIEKEENVSYPCFIISHAPYGWNWWYLFWWCKKKIGNTNFLCLELLNGEKFYLSWICNFVTKGKLNSHLNALMCHFGKLLFHSNTTPTKKLYTFEIVISIYDIERKYNHEIHSFKITFGIWKIIKTASFCHIP